MRGRIRLLALLLCGGCATPGVPERAIGECRDGVAEGSYTLIDPRGGVEISGAFAHGRREGAFQFFGGAGARLAQIPYHDDRIDGTVLLWYRPQMEGAAGSRHKLEAHYRSGVLDGEKRSWYPAGERRGDYWYADGALERAEAWDADGTALEPEAARGMATRDRMADDPLYRAYEEIVNGHLPRCGSSPGREWRRAMKRGRSVVIVDAASCWAALAREEAPAPRAGPRKP